MISANVCQLMNLYLNSVRFWSSNTSSVYKNVSKFWTESFRYHKYFYSPYFVPYEMSRLSGPVQIARLNSQTDTVHFSFLLSYEWRSFDTVCKCSSRCRKVHPSCVHVRSDGSDIFQLHSRNHRTPTGIIREINFRLNSFQNRVS
jgi:hypothetical protein